MTQKMIPKTTVRAAYFYAQKLRVGLVSADNRVSGGDSDSYNEYRFELNYLFLRLICK